MPELHAADALPYPALVTDLHAADVIARLQDARIEVLEETEASA